MNELALLVDREKKGLASLIGVATLGWFFVASAAYMIWAPAVTVATLGWLGCYALYARKVRRYNRLLSDHAGIERIERVDWLGRPAVRVCFAGGATVRLPTWNHDRERVIALLETRELPAARLLR
ncbi:MAG TPA: hypothetical protein VLT45_03900 [Kofleriaceae bacterium]|nr:hypothetical protein [Kofleriaceae bacterium]